MTSENSLVGNSELHLTAPPYVDVRLWETASACLRQLFTFNSRLFRAAH